MRDLFRNFFNNKSFLTFFRWTLFCFIAGFVLTGCSGPSLDDGPDISDPDLPPPYVCNPQPYNPLRNAYFGDLHQHTSYSLDAFAAKNLPEQAYRFARGELTDVPPYDENGDSMVEPLSIGRPLDFAAVTDHSEWLGERQLCTDESIDPVAYNSPECLVYRQDVNTGFLLLGGAWTAIVAGVEAVPSIFEALGQQNIRPTFCGLFGTKCVEASLSPWADTQAQAERFNEPGCFTTFNGYEYTLSPLGDNMHRNVIFRNEHVPKYPVTAYDAGTPPALWEKLDEECEAPCEYLTIPHGVNLSNSRAFVGPEEDNYLIEDRRRAEPIIEMFQIEGDSECSTVETGSPNDPLCSFEKWPFTNFAEYFIGVNPSPGKDPAQSFVRFGLKQGLIYENQYGSNPFEYGFIASTDGHYGLPGAVDESNWPGAQIIPPVDGVKDEEWNNPGGLAVAWAEENTRDALFDAFKRKETYATSGPRIHLRVFGGDSESIPQDLCSSPGEDFVESGYANGVPMGGKVTSVNGKMRIAAWAAADPLARENGGQLPVPLQKIQIVKGWTEVSSDGSEVSHEEVFDVASADNLNWEANEHTCEVQSTGSSGQLCVVWDDPNFSNDSNSFYYVRVVEPPSCRWLTRQCLAAPENLNCDDPDQEWAACCSVEDGEYPRLIQERAWSSPIWYQP